MAPNTLPHPNDLVDPGTPTPYPPMPRQAGPRRGLTMIRASGRAPDRAGPSLARRCAIGIVGLGGAAVAFELLGRH